METTYDTHALTESKIMCEVYYIIYYTSVYKSCEVNEEKKLPTTQTFWFFELN